MSPPNIVAVGYGTGVTDVVPHRGVEGKVGLWVKCRCTTQS